MTTKAETKEAGLAVTRERRSNAGARMSRLLQAEDEDEFYKTTYGGFAEEEDDNDYESESASDAETDSDIDIDENDEVKSDGEEEGAKRTRRLVTKAYKEPKKETVKDSKPIVAKPKPVSVAKPPKVEIIETSPEKKLLRQSTAEKSRSTEGTAKEREAKAAMMKAIAERKKVASVRRLTQEELLAEAMVTEQINLRSLEMYQRLELEKKRSKVHRPVQHGPVIRYRSVTEITSQNQPSNYHTDDIMDIETGDQQMMPDKSDHCTEKKLPTPDKCSRNYITFTDEKLFNQYFPPSYRGSSAGVRTRNAAPQKQFCVVTGLPAKYFDPLTQLPYATAAAFKILREEYAEQQASIDNDAQEDIAVDDGGNKRR